LAKALDAFRNIGEVSVELGIKKHVLRFWELKFPQLKPMKRGGGRRLYRPSDVELLRGIRDLLQDAGYTIKGVQRLLREHGVERIKSAAAPEPSGRAREAAGGSRDQPRPRLVPPLPAARTKPVLFSAQEVKALRAVMAELEACRGLLAGPRVDPRAPVSRHRVAD
jgi:DNA-binding transcriptional MerR regulator